MQDIKLEMSIIGASYGFDRNFRVWEGNGWFNSAHLGQHHILRDFSTEKSEKIKVKIRYRYLPKWG